MLSKRDLGVGYLSGLGLGLAVVVLGRHLVFDLSEFGSTVGTGTGLILSLSLVYVGGRLSRSDLDDEHVWRVAQWGAVGLAVPVVLNVAAILAFEPMALRYPGALVNHVAAGGIAGVLVGSVVELLARHRETRDLHRRNAILNRVLRHNIRNDMNVVRGTATLLAEDADGEREARLDVIREQADDIVGVSRAARRIESFATGERLEPLDLVAHVERAIADLGGTDPAVAADADLPDSRLVFADHRLEHAVGTFLAETVAAGPEPGRDEADTGRRPDAGPDLDPADPDLDPADPGMRVAVTDGPGWVTLAVERRDGGRLARKFAVLSRDVETKLSHLDGVDLWLVQWLVEDYGGEVGATGADSDRSVAWMRLRPAETHGDRLRNAVRTSSLLGAGR